MSEPVAVASNDAKDGNVAEVDDRKGQEMSILKYALDSFVTAGSVARIEQIPTVFRPFRSDNPA